MEEQEEQEEQEGLFKAKKEEEEEGLWLSTNDWSGPSWLNGGDNDV